MSPSRLCHPPPPVGGYDDVVYRAVPDAGAVVQRAATGVETGADRVFVKAFPPPALAAIT